MGIVGSSVKIKDTDTLEVKLDEYSSMLEISVKITDIVKIDGKGDEIRTQTLVQKYRLQDLEIMFPEFAFNNMSINRQGGGVSINTDSSIMGEILDYAGKISYTGGMTTDAAKSFLKSRGWHAPIYAPKGSGYGYVSMPGTSKWPSFIGRRGTQLLKNASSMAKPVAGVGAAVTIVYDGVGVLKWFDNPTDSHVVHPVKAAADIAFLAVGFCSPVGAVISVIYFGVDAFYPGGWEGLYNDWVVPVFESHWEKTPVQFIDSPINKELFAYPGKAQDYDKLLMA